MFDMIQSAHPEDMNDLLLAVRRRYRELFPDWDLIILSIEKTADKTQQLDQIVALLEQQKAQN